MFERRVGLGRQREAPIRQPPPLSSLVGLSVGTIIFNCVTTLPGRGLQQDSRNEQCMMPSSSNQPVSNLVVVVVVVAIEVVVACMANWWQ